MARQHLPAAGALIRIAINPIAYSDDLFAPLLAECNAGQGRFLFRLRNDWLSGANRFGKEGEALVGAFVEGKLAGVAALNRDPFSDEPGLGRLRHVYVAVALRRRGIGRMLVADILRRAHGRFTAIRLTTQLPEARRLYESFGFVRSEAPHEDYRLLL